jgi:hypothetical protein
MHVPIGCKIVNPNDIFIGVIDRGDGPRPPSPKLVGPSHNRGQIRVVPPAAI